MDISEDKKTRLSSDGDAATNQSVADGTHKSLDARGQGVFDAAAEFLDAHQQEFDNVTPEEMKRVLWKIDMRIIPVFMISIITAAVDKTVLSNAALYGMTTDLKLSGSLYSWTASIFYFGYLVAEYPANVLCQKLPVAKFLAGTYFCWSIILCLMGATQNAAGILVLRFLMGIFEAPLFPICSIMTVMWYTKTEQPIRTALWFNGFSSLFTGLVSYGIGHTHTSVAAWRLLFIVLGAWSLLWSLVILAVLPDSPVNNKFLNTREKYIAIMRIRDNMTGTENRKVKWNQVKEALLDWKTWTLCAFAICLNVPNGGLITFSAQIVSGLGYSRLRTTLLGMPTGVVMTFSSWLVAWPASRLSNRRSVLVASACIPPLICCVLMMKLPKDNKVGLLIAYMFFYSYWGPYANVISLPFANTSGHAKKTTVNAMMFLSYCVANIIAPQFFIASEAPHYQTGYRAILACISIGFVVVLAYGFGVHRENQIRDKRVEELRMAGVDVDTEREAEMLMDKTDKEKIYFRYIY